MSDEAQRIAIAESVGIYLHDGDHAPSDYVFVSDLPDYLNDLNAIHEVENKNLVSHAMWDSYLDNLESICERENLGRYITNATAAQRAEAILKTLGKWEGGEDA